MPLFVLGLVLNRWAWESFTCSEGGGNGAGLTGQECLESQIFNHEDCVQARRTVCGEGVSVGWHICVLLLVMLVLPVRKRWERMLMVWRTAGAAAARSTRMERLLVLVMLRGRVGRRRGVNLRLN